MDRVEATRASSNVRSLELLHLSVHVLLHLSLGLLPVPPHTSHLILRLLPPAPRLHSLRIALLLQVLHSTQARQ